MKKRKVQKVEISFPRKYLSAVNETLRALEQADKPPKVLARKIRITKADEKRLVKVSNELGKLLSKFENEQDRIENMLDNNEGRARSSDLKWYQQQQDRISDLIEEACDRSGII